MYLSINNCQTNAYLIKKQNRIILAKKNHFYKISEGYNKIIGTINNKNNGDIISITQAGFIGISLNTNWCFKNNEINLTKTNILLPSDEDLHLAPFNKDIHTMNCLCKNSTNIKKLPTIYVNINNSMFRFDKWTGYNQAWVSIQIIESFIGYGYLYVFRDQAIFTASFSVNNEEINHHNDLDIISKSTFTNTTKDIHGRIDCNNLEINFQNLEILNQPLSLKTDTISIKTEHYV